MVEHFILPWPPTVNTYWQKARSGHTFLSKKAREFREECVSRYSFDKTKAYGGPVGAILIYYPPDKRVRDIDNYNKGVLDCLKYCGVIKDDRQIHPLLTDWGEVTKPGAVDIHFFTDSKRDKIKSTIRSFI